MGFGWMKELAPGGQVEVKGSNMYGSYKGFYVVVQYLGNDGYSVSVNYAGYQEGFKERLSRYMDTMKAQQKKIYKLSIDDYTMNIRIRLQAWGNGKKLCQPVLDGVINFLQQEGATSGCEACGTQIDVNLVNINGMLHYMCSACKEEIHTALEDRKQQLKVRKSNVVAGIVGAFLGALLGGVIWFIIYQLGYVAAIAGIITVICAIWGYEKLGGSMDVKGIIITCVFSVLMIYMAERASWSYTIYNAFKADYDLTFFDAFRATPAIIAENDLTSSFVGDLLIGYLLSAVGAASVIIRKIKEAKGIYSIK